MLAKHSWSTRGVRVIAFTTPNPACLSAITTASSSSLIPPGGWLAQGPGQFHGHSPPPNNSSLITCSPAMRISYTTVPVKTTDILSRRIHTTICRWDESLKPSSQVERTVKDIKEKVKESESTSEKASDKLVKNQDKPKLMQRIKDEIIHYYHGFKLLFIDVRISSKYVWRTVNGDTLSRREYRQVSSFFHFKYY